MTDDPVARHIRDLCLQARRAALQEVLDHVRLYREKPNTYSEVAAHIEKFVDGLMK